ncbi:MAG: glycosyltransferase family 4 protein [DPANN group archaeon]|nr:glycosyltransferase family 4 protein [DPANN group archaeon]
MAAELAKRGHEIHVFTSDRRGAEVLKNTYEAYNGVHIHRYRTLVRYKYYFFYNAGMVSDILRRNFDVLHFHNIGHPQWDAILLATRLLKKTKCVNTPHGNFFAGIEKSFFGKIFKTVYRLWEFPFNRLYHACVKVNQLQHKWLPEYGFKKKLVYIPDGIPAERFKKIDNSEFLERHGLSGKFVICNLGRLLPYKGLDQMVKILPKILKKYPEVVFLSMGPDRGDLLRLKNLAKELNVEKNVVFVGEVSEDDKLRGLDASRIFVFPSQPGTEFFGIGMLEGMARGVVPIATRQEGPNFLLRDGENGMLFNYGNLTELKEKILFMIEHSEFLEAAKKQNFGLAKSFVNEEIAKSLEAVYFKLCKGTSL